MTAPTLSSAAARTASPSSPRRHMTARGLTRWTVVAVIVGHGLVHLLGAAKGLGWADVPQLTRQISVPEGIAWLGAAALMIGTGLLLAASVRWWWIVGAVSFVASQTLIVTVWPDAAAGTVANGILLLAVLQGFASQGATSYRAEFRRSARAALAGSVTGPVVHEADLGRLPDLVASYVRRSGAVGQPRVTSLHAHVSGRIRSGAASRWMTFHGEQVNTFGPNPSRIFFIDATMLGLPIDVLHTFIGSSARMRVRAGSLLRVVDASGPEMDQGETVTVFNDLCVLAPSALIDASIRWQPIDSHQVHGEFTRGDQTVTAVLTFDDAHDLIDFTSDDRLRASSDGRHFVPQRWSTPLGAHRSFGPIRISAAGDGRWDAPPPEGEFTYIEFHVDQIAYNVQQNA